MENILDVINTLCSVITVAITIFTASKVYQISKHITIDKSRKKGNINKIKGDIGNNYVGGDQINGKQ